MLLQTKHLFGGLVEGHRSIDQLESVLHLQHQLLPVVGHLQVKQSLPLTPSATLLRVLLFMVSYFPRKIAKEQYLLCTLPDQVHVVVVCLE